jgi:hypothetical protein
VKPLVPAVVKQAAEETEAAKVEATPAMPATPKVEAPPAIIRGLDKLGVDNKPSL